jgi:hypothetical protein
MNFLIQHTRAPRRGTSDVPRRKSSGLRKNFLVSNAFKFQSLHTKFDTVIDCGLFHVFSDEERPIFAASLSSALYPGGKYFMLCFSEHEPGSWGPRRVTQAEIRATFGKGWKVNTSGKRSLKQQLVQRVLKRGCPLSLICRSAEVSAWCLMLTMSILLFKNLYQLCV